MKTSLLSLFAGTVFLAGAAIAGAGEPTNLSSAQLDAVTAGQPYNASATAFIAQSNSATVDVDQSATATASGNYSRNTASATNISTVDIDQSNTNRGNVYATAIVR